MRRNPKTTINPVLPRELDRATPRPVSFTSLGALAFAGAIALGLGAVFAGIWLYARAEGDAQLAQELRSAGVTIQARILSVQHRRGENNRSIATYRYVVGGVEYSGQARPRKRDRDRIPTGAIRPVRYLQSDPSRSWLAGYEPRGLPHWLVWLISSSLLICATSILIWLRRQYQLLEDGRPALARVTRISKQTGHDHATWRVDYEWQLLNGARRFGRYETATKPPQVGEFIAIVYDRNQPLRHRKYPFSLVCTRR